MTTLAELMSKTTPTLRVGSATFDSLRAALAYRDNLSRMPRAPGHDIPEVALSSEAVFNPEFDKLVEVRLTEDEAKLLYTILARCITGFVGDLRPVYERLRVYPEMRIIKGPTPSPIPLRSSIKDWKPDQLRIPTIMRRIIKVDAVGTDLVVENAGLGISLTKIDSVDQLKALVQEKKARKLFLQVRQQRSSKYVYDLSASSLVLASILYITHLFTPGIMTISVMKGLRDKLAAITRRTESPSLVEDNRSTVNRHPPYMIGE